jgi:hypothetical protein
VNIRRRSLMQEPPQRMRPTRMKTTSGWRAVGIGLAAIVVWCALMSAEPAMARQLSTDQFANVFLETQPVQVAVAAGEATAVQLRDLAGAEMARRDASSDAAKLDFGTLPPGYYEAVAGDTVLPLVVLIDPARHVPGPSRLAMDNAMSWLVDADQWQDVARLLQACGITCVRERLSWGEVERSRGQLEWGRYDRTATILHEHGIDVYQVFHSIPAWARADEDQRAAPDDLREIYRFAQALARQFQGRVQAWEVWNEPDIFFFSHPSSECAAYQKAAFLGFRSVDPAQRVLGPSMAYGAGAFSQGLLENGAGQYFDIWNFHMYADPSAYSGRRDGFLEQLARHHVVVPDWMTEAGDPLQSPGGVLTHEARIHQAEFLSRAYPQALAAGVDRHFWFVFPFLREGESGWGLFEPHLRQPYPGLAALGAATYALGRGDCLGSLPLPDKDARAIAFARGDETVGLAVWREAKEPAEVALPWDWAVVQDVRTHLGTPLAREQGPVTVRVARGAVYLIVPRSAVEGKLTPPAHRPIAPRDEAARVAEMHDALPAIVVRLRVPQGVPDKAIDAYRVRAGAAAELQAEVYNFGTEAISGQLQLDAPSPWKIESATAAVTVAPGERVVVPLRLTVPQQKDPAAIRLEVTAGTARSTPAVVRLCVDLSSLAPRESLALSLDDSARWRSNIAGHGSMKIEACSDGGVRFSFTFSADGDKWAYPLATFAPELDLSTYDGLRFEYRTSVAESGPVRAFLFEPAGSGYISDTALPGSETWRSATVLFSQLGYVSVTPPDANGKLDINRIASLSVGAHCKPRSLVLEVRNIQAVKF